MKILIAVLAIVVSAHAARILPSEARPSHQSSGLRCLRCVDASSEAECLQTGSIVTCAAGEVCMTHIVTDESGVSTVNKGCQQRDICSEHQEQFGDYCTGVGQPQSTCHFCCDRAECNGSPRNFGLPAQLGKDKSTSPKSTEPKETSPKETTPPKETSPKETSPKQTSPKETSPKQTSPKQTSPKQTSPKQTSPKETTPQPATTTTTTQEPCELPCQPNPCQNEGVCFPRILHGDYVCLCPPGYYGRNCEGDYCDPNPCLNGGECLGDDGGYGCRCPEGFEGEHCEIAVDPCDPSPCAHGTCFSHGDRIFCRCDAGYEGRYCENEVVDPCDPNPCVHGSCVANGGDFTCQCDDGFEGALCENEVVDPCDPDPCVHGTCVPEGDSYTCHCDDGYEGHHCENETPSGGYDCGENNPCDPENTAENGYYYPHHDEEYFVQCDAWGGCFVMPCAPGTVWDQEAYTCVHA